MNENSPGPTPTSSTETLERPPKPNNASNDSIINNALSSAPKLDNMPSGNNEDTLLTFYQSLVPPHVRVFKREHPARHPNETDEEYEFRWQFYEYAKLHPLTRPTFFYDIEIKDELLVPVKDSSSTCFTIINDNEQNITRSINGSPEAQQPVQSSHQELDDETWEIESIPNTLPLECPRELMKFSKTCVKLHSTVSISNLPTLRSVESLEELLDLSRSLSDFQTSVIFPQREGFRSKLSKSVSFANPIKRVRLVTPVISSRSRSLPQRRPVVKDDRKSYFMNYPSSRSSRSLNSFEKNVKFKTFEEMFHRPGSNPSKNLYSSVEQRKKLSSRYTFFMHQREQNKRDKIGSLQDKLKWVSERLHRGKSTTIDSNLDHVDVAFVKVNKNVPKFFNFPNFSKLFRNKK